MKKPQTPDDERIARKAVAFDVFLDAIPTVRNPKGRPELVEKMMAILNGEDPGEPARQPTGQQGEQDQAAEAP